MANTLIATANGNLTSSSTWKTVDATSLLDSEASTTTLTTTPTDSSTFTPGAITIDGIAIKLSSRAASPSGTITVTLRNSSGGSDVTSVTINVSDINVNGNGWYFFKFDANQTLSGGVNYAVRLSTSASNQVTVFRNATAANYSRLLRTTTTAAPGAGDQMVITGEWTGAGAVTTRTVTNDSTSAATTYGATTFTQSIHIGNNGKLQQGTTTSTAYLFKVAGIVGVYGGGTFDVWSAGVPSGSTLDFAWAVSVNVDGGLVFNAGATGTIFGVTKSNVKTLLTTDVSAAGTVLHVGSTSGWANGDLLGIASTTRTAGDSEQATILTVDSGTQVTLTAGVGHAHSGTSPTQAEVVNLTRRTLFHGTSTSLQAYINIAATASVTLSSIEIKWMGSGTSGKRGLDIGTTTGSFTMQYCALHDFTVSNSAILIAANTNNYTIDSNVFYGVNQGFTNNGTNNTSWSVTNNVSMAGSNIGFNLGGLTGTVTGNVSCGNSQFGIQLNDTHTIGTFSGNTSHSNNNSGLLLSNPPASPFTLDSLAIWRNNGGISITVTLNGGSSANGNNVISNSTIFGNNGFNLQFNSATAVVGLVLLNCTLAGDTTFSTTNGVSVTGNNFLIGITLVNTTLGVSSRIFNAHTSADLSFGVGLTWQVTGDNSKLASSTPVLYSPGQWSVASYVRMQSVAAGLHESWYPNGAISYDTTSYGFSSGFSERLTPNSASAKLQSASKFIPVASGGAPTVTVKVRESVVGDGAAYNGNAPRLIVKRNYSLGITADTVLATFGGSAGAVTTLSATLPTASADGLYEVVVDCDGTAGWVNATDWSTSSLASETTQEFWRLGLPGSSAQRPIAQQGVGYATIQ